MKFQQPPMEATMFAMRDQDTGRNMMRNILIGQAAGSLGNMALDIFEPSTPKRPEEKDVGDKARDFLRGAINLGTGINYAYQLGRGYDVFGGKESKAAPETPSAASQTTSQALKALPEGRSTTGEGSGTPPPPTTPAAPTPYTARQDLGGMQARRPGDNEFTSRSTQLQMDLGAANAVDAAVNQQVMPGAYGGGTQLGIPGLGGGDKSLMQRQREQEEFVKAARSERMPGVMQNLNEQIDAEMAQRLSGLQKEAAAYPKATEVDYREQGLEAGRQYLSDQAAQVAKEPVVSTPKGPAYTGPTTTSTNPLLSREPASSFAEQYGLSSTEKIDRDVRKAEDAESIANFYASIPADPETGERDVSSFLQGFNEGRGAVEPRNSGELLSDQLEGQTAFSQQESREPFIQEQAAEAINALDEQGPGFTSGSLADIFTQGARELAQSDARLYRNTGESLSKMKQILSEFSTEGKTDIPTQSQKQLSATKAEAQKDDYLKEALSYLGKAQADTQRQLMEMKNQTVVPTAETNPDYVKSDFLVPAPSKTLSSIGERLRKAELSIGGAPEEFGGDGFDVELPGSYRRYPVDSPAALAAFERAGVTRQEATDYWMDKMKSSGILESVRAKQEEDKPAIKKTTIIEEVETPQQSMKPMDVAEKLRRIQTSGRPNARQEAQDFLSSIKEQMTNG